MKTIQPSTPSFEDLKKMLQEKFPGGIPRPKIGEATGGILNPRTLANLDSLGSGICGRYIVGRTVVYRCFFNKFQPVYIE